MKKREIKRVINEGYEAGKNQSEIADMLNEAKLESISGKPWTQPMVSHAARLLKVGVTPQAKVPPPRGQRLKKERDELLYSVIESKRLSSEVKLRVIQELL